jgi:hypothetical protein
MIAVMLTPTTMSAFSSGVSQAGFGQVSAVQRVRSDANQQTPPNTALAPPPSVPAAGGFSPGQKLPRGSLLDLSV